MLHILLSALLIPFFTLAGNSVVNPPQAEKINHELKNGSDVRVDPYYWLRDIKNPKVKKHLEAENAYYKAYFSQQDRKLQQKIFNEIKSKIEEADTTAPIVFGEYEYYSKTMKGKNYRQHIRRKLGTMKEEVLLDENIRAKGKSYFASLAKEFSPDLSKLAWCFDYDGSGRCEIEIQDLATKKINKIGVTGVYFGNLSWAPDSKTLFYIMPNQSWRPFEIWLTDFRNEKRKILSEANEIFELNIYLTTDRQYLMAVSSSFDESQVYYWNGKEFTVLVPLKPKIMVQVDHSRMGFFARSNHKNKNYGVYQFEEVNSQVENWKVVVNPDPQAKLDDFSPHEDDLIYSLGRSGIDEIHVLDLVNKKNQNVVFQDKVYAAKVNHDGYPIKAIVTYSSPLSPTKTYILDPKSIELKLIKAKKSPTLNPQLYQTELRYVKSRDGKDIPIHMAYRKDKRRNNPQPLHLEGYGSYGFSMPSVFDETLFSLLDRGFVYVSAHVRGSDAQGEVWYEEGRLLNKKNTFNDFIDVAKYLIQEKWTNSQMLSIQGASAGGLLVGAVINQEPELFRAVLAGVPFVDVLTTMLDTSLPLTTQEYLQWGNPNEEAFYKYIKSYSPYDNVRKAEYPAIFVQTGINDQQVSYWEPAKWVQKLREHTQSKHPIIMRVNMGAGHGGSSGRYNKYDEIAEQYVFLIKELNAL